VRCYFMRDGHIASVEAIPGFTDEETVRRAHLLFEERRKASAYDGFEVWDLARVVLQYPVTAADKVREGG
jgi:hypothetical protein